MNKKVLSIFLMLVVALVSGFMTSCQDGETYAKMKEKEKDAIKRFIQGKNAIFEDPVTVISEEEFAEQDYTTDTLNNEYVLFKSSGIYLQIRQKGEGKSMIEIAKADPDSTINQYILCRFYEYDIEAAAVTAYNIYSANTANPDKMLCNYSRKARTYTASFTNGVMMNAYGSAVPTGWLKPLDYVKLGRHTDKLAEVRIIVPHSSGTSNAASYVLPMFYEISYEMGR